MNKTLKTSLIIAAAIAIIGLIITIIGFVAGGMQGVVFGSDGIKLASEDSNTKTLNESFVKIKSIDADLDLRDIILKEGTGFKVESKGVGKNFRVDDNNGHITLSENSTTGFTLNLFGFWESHQYSDLVITYPAGTNFEDIKISSDSGTLTIADLNAKNIDLDSDLGDVELKNVIASRLSVKIDSGTLDLDQAKTDTFNFELGLGDLDAKNLTGKTVKGKLDSGSADIEGTITGPVEIYNDLGDVDMTLAGNEDSYSYELATDLGDVVLNGQDSSGNITKINGNKPLIKVTSDMGTVSINFKAL